MKPTQIISMSLLAMLMLIGDLAAQKDSLFDYRYYDSLTVMDAQGDSLKQAWAGGINLGQFGRIDVDRDGRKDLVEFDRDGGNFKVFINQALGRYVDYKHAPEYSSRFPEDIEWFAYFKDYNNDGKEDIWAQHPYGLKIYKNVSDSVLRFQPLCNFRDFVGNPVCYVTAQFQGIGGSVNYFNVEVPAADKPAIEDINFDGKLDLLTFGDEFSLAANTINYYKNISTDPDSLVLKNITACWGLFFENDTTNGIITNFYCPDSGGLARILRPETVKRGAARHTGSTITAMDIGGDHTMDLAVGDIAYSNMILLNNTGDSNKARISSFDTLFPSNTKGVDLGIFPAAYYVDVDNDNERDLLVTPGAAQESMDRSNVWHYENVQLDENPSFAFVKKDFLVGEMIDIGTMAFPSFVDVNGDSLIDMLVGNDAYMKPNFEYYSRVAYYRNVGTYNDSVRIPAFQLVDSNYLNLESQQLRSIQLEFGDLDGDADQDLLIGLQDGSLRYYENTATNPGDSLNLQASPGWDSTLTTTAFTSPELYDIDMDGDLDLILGEQHGTLEMYLNQGDSSQPSFSPGFKIPNFGGIEVKNVFGDGFVVPEVIKIDSTGKLAGRYEEGEGHLFLGSIFGQVEVYDNIDSNLFGNFQKVDSIPHSRYRIAPSIADVYGDSLPDLFLGEQAGGLVGMLRGRGILLAPPPFNPCDTCVFPDTCISGICVPITVNPCDTCVYPDTCINNNCVPSSILEWRWNGIKLYPNPAIEKFTVESPGATIKEIELYDLLGRQLKVWNFHREDNIRQADLRLPEITSKELMVRIKTFETRDKNLILLRH